MENPGFKAGGNNVLQQAADFVGGLGSKSHETDRDASKLTKSLVKAGVIKTTPSLYGKDSRFGRAQTRGFNAGVYRGIQEKIDAANQMSSNLSSSQQTSSTTSTTPKPTSKPKEQKMDSFSNPPSSKTAKGINVLGGKGERRNQKQNRNVNPPKPKRTGKPPRPKMKQRGGPKR